jgi:hypothetical protein
VRESIVTDDTSRDSLMGWEDMIEPLLTKAICDGFELTPNSALYQENIKLTLKGQKVNATEFIQAVAKDRGTKEYLSRFFSNKKLKFVPYSNNDMNILLMVGELMDTSITAALPNTRF